MQDKSVRLESWNQDEAIDLIQFAIEEGTGDSCSVEEATDILIAWQQF